MGENSKIEWTDATWNPVRGCTKVSQGCKNCYAETFAERWRGVAGHPFEQGFDLRLVPEKLSDPWHWKKPRRIFVNSMSDLFHADVPFGYIAKVFAVMAVTPRHTYQVLTKRPERAAEFFAWMAEDPAERMAEAVRDVDDLAYEDFDIFVSNYVNGWSGFTTHSDGNPLNGTVRRWPLSNVWVGVSVEDQAAADSRIPILLQIPAAVRFLSCEPLLGPVRFMVPEPPLCIHDGFGWNARLSIAERSVLDHTPKILPKTRGDIHGIHWVIAGGESGSKARPSHPDWFRSLRDQCVAAGVAFHFKQWGEWAPGENVERSAGVVRTATIFGGRWDEDREDLSRTDGHVDDQPDVYRVGKKAAGRELDGRTWDELPHAPHA